MPVIEAIVDLFSNTLETLRLWGSLYGGWVYGILFLILFCETGLVVTPFLPGDSLLFAAGTLAGTGVFDIWKLIAIVTCAVILGDNTNFALGRFFGQQVMASPRLSKLLKPEYLARTQAFFAKHGGKSISLARFFPIIRTYAPFIAGVSQMRWPKFAAFSCLGTIGWVTLCVGGGYFLGGLPFIRDHFEIIVCAIILVSISPMLYHALMPQLAARKKNVSNRVPPKDC